MAATCTGVGVENRAAVSRSFNEGDIDNSEKLCILLSCWPEVGGHTPQIRRQPQQSPLPVFFFLNYAENERRIEGRVFSDQFTEPEGPHNTPNALSA
jgi:hypothetical protein